MHHLSCPALAVTLAVWALAGCSGDELTKASTADTAPGSTADTAAPGPTPVVRDPRFETVVPVLEAELVGNLAEGVSIAVMEQGRFTWLEGFGTADPGDDEPMTPDHILQIGSTTKQMTAAHVLQQVDAGLLRLEDPVSTALPGYALQQTLHDLLSHQGGLFDYTDTSNPPDDAALADWYYGFFADNIWAMNDPGLFWNYSNPHFSLAGLITEEHDPAGRAFADQLEQDLFAPLGLRDTFARKEAVRGTGRRSLSVGIDATGAIAEIPMRDVPDPASDRPAGFVWSTPADMARWGRFLLQGEPSVLSEASRSLISTPHVPTLYNGDHEAYGYGMFVWDLYPLSDGYYPIQVLEHGGNTLSFTSVLVLLPEHDVSISILSAGYGDTWSDTTEGILRAVIDPLPAASAYTGEPFDPSALGAHIGSYDDPHNVGPIEITAGGAYGLQIAMPLLDAYGYAVDPDLIPISTDLWLVDLGGIVLDLTFIREPGSPSAFVRNRAFVGARTPGGVALVSPDPSGSRASRIAATLEIARRAVPMRLPPPVHAR